MLHFKLLVLIIAVSSLLFSAKAWSPRMVPVSKFVKSRPYSRLLKRSQPYGLKIESLEPEKWEIGVKIDRNDGERKTVLHDREKHTITLTFAKHELINDEHYLEFSISDLNGVSHMFLRTLNSKLEKVHICEQLGEILAANELKRRNMPDKCPIASEKPIRYQLTMNDEWWKNIEKHRRELMNKEMTFNVKLWKGKPCARCSSKSILHLSIPIYMSSA